MDETSEKPPEGWPRCEPEQVQVLLLGTYHMDNNDLNEINIDADDVLADERQRQLEELVECFIDWGPEHVAVERPQDEFTTVNDCYEKYRTGEYAYDHEEIFPAPHPFRDADDTECRSEVVQIGFRLADRLNHDRVYPVDEFPDEPDNDPFEDREIDSTRKTEVSPRNPDAIEREGNEQLASSSLIEYFAWRNSEAVLRNNHDLTFDRGIRVTDEQFGSPMFLAYWYDRNIRMVHHLWRALEERTDRMLFLVGSGHIRVLRHLLDEAPMFCPVSPLPYLSDS